MRVVHVNTCRQLQQCDWITLVTFLVSRTMTGPGQQQRWLTYLNQAVPVRIWNNSNNIFKSMSYLLTRSYYVLRPPSEFNSTHVIVKLNQQGHAGSVTHDFRLHRSARPHRATWLDIGQNILTDDWCTRLSIKMFSFFLFRVYRIYNHKGQRLKIYFYLWYFGSTFIICMFFFVISIFYYVNTLQLHITVAVSNVNVNLLSSRLTFKKKLTFVCYSDFSMW